MLASASGAVAHTGAEHTLSFAAGFAHPWSGLDHILAMVAVGLWAGLKGGRAAWAWPLSFVAVMVAGGFLGFAGVPVPMVEPGILASIIVLGLLVFLAVDVPVAAGAALVAVFAVLHGHAHGGELPADAAGMSFAAGFGIATAMLHGIGLLIAYVGSGEGSRIIVRACGGATALAGLLLAIL
jgi:urease accessory protein